MADPSLYTYPSPLEGWENLAPLPTERAADGKSYINPPATEKSPAYTSFVAPITNGIRGGFDIHIYYQQNNDEEKKFAFELWERIRREFPELRIYTFWDKPIGPHPVAMFEVNLFTPEQFGAFIPWLVINRGPLSALVHPNTEDDVRDHSQRATWMGQPFPLQLGGLRKFVEAKKRKQEEEGRGKDSVD
ncbi:DOPA-like domain-containing protein [Delphinella strobiligena]|nr:DOPA-like domain-containing protein [Delphinella strobiligena]